MHRPTHVLAIIALSLALASCSANTFGPAGSQADASRLADAPAKPSGTASPAMATDPPASCPVTQPPNPPFVPPSPYPSTPPPLYRGQFWYGTEGLWTMPPADGTWRGLAGEDGSYGQKTFWWRQGYSWKADPEPELKVTGRRLDAQAPALEASAATNGFRDDIGSFMLVGVDFPTPGCWEITGQVAEAKLSFVVSVAP
jgi:hypothetical protein